MNDEYELMWKSVIENEDGSINWVNLKATLQRFTELKVALDLIIDHATGTEKDSNSEIPEIINTMDDLLSDVMDEALSNELALILSNITGAESVEDLYTYISHRKGLYDGSST